MIEAAIFCLALNAYHEARGEGALGMLAVSQVVVQRAEHPSGRWPRDICGVVFQGGERKGKCQFSWYCDGRSDKPRDARAWAAALVVAEAARRGAGFPTLSAATCYHAAKVKPAWTASARFVGKRRDHLYYEC